MKAGKESSAINVIPPFPPPGNPSSSRVLLSGIDGNRPAPNKTPVLLCRNPLPAGPTHHKDKENPEGE